MREVLRVFKLLVNDFANYGGTDTSECGHALIGHKAPRMLIRSPSLEAHKA